MATYFNGKPMVLVGGSGPGQFKLTNQTDDGSVLQRQPVSAQPATQQTVQPSATTAPASQPQDVVKPPENKPTPTEPAPSTPPPATPTPQPQQPTQQPKPQAPPPSSPTTTATTPNSGQMANDLYQRAVQTMNNPSRYDADLVKQGAQVIQDTIDRMRTTGTRNISEQMAARGLTGSSLEMNADTDLEAQLQAQERSNLFDLQREQANTYSQDVNSAFGQGLGAAGLGEQVAGRQAQNDYQNRALDSSNYFNQGQLDLGNRTLDSNNYFQQGDLDYRNKALDADTRLRQQGIDLQGRGLDQNQMAMVADLVERYGPGILDSLGLGGAGTSGTNTGTSLHVNPTGGTQPTKYF